MKGKPARIRTKRKSELGKKTKCMIKGGSKFRYYNGKPLMWAMIILGVLIGFILFIGIP